VIKNIFTRFKAMVAVVALTSGLLTFAAAPASASTTLWGPAGIQAQIDNNPGNGSPSWAWLYSANWPNHVWVKAHFPNGDYTATVVDLWQANQSKSVNVWDKIDWAQICIVIAVPYEQDYCGDQTKF